MRARVHARPARALRAASITRWQTSIQVSIQSLNSERDYCYKKFCEVQVSPPADRMTSLPSIAEGTTHVAR